MEQYDRNNQTKFKIQHDTNRASLENIAVNLPSLYADKC